MVWLKKKKQIQLNLPKNYEESQYIKRLPYIINKGPDFNNKFLDVLRNRDDLKKWVLATSEYGDELQDNLNAIVGYDEKFNNTIAGHALDLKNNGIFQNSSLLNLTFCDVKKFDLQNPIIGKLTTQVKANKLPDYDLTKKLLANTEIANIKNRLQKLRKKTKFNNSNDESSPTGGDRGGGGGDDGTPPRSPGKDEFDELTRKLNRLYGNRPPLPPSRTSSLTPRSCIDDVVHDDDEPDKRGILNNRLHRLRYGPLTQKPEDKFLAKRLSER